MNVEERLAARSYTEFMYLLTVDSLRAYVQNRHHNTLMVRASSSDVARAVA